MCRTQAKKPQPLLRARRDKLPRFGAELTRRLLVKALCGQSNPSVPERRNMRLSALLHEHKAVSSVAPERKAFALELVEVVGRQGECRSGAVNKKRRQKAGAQRHRVCPCASASPPSVRRSAKFPIQYTEFIILYSTVNFNKKLSVFAIVCTKSSIYGRSVEINRRHGKLS